MRIVLVLFVGLILVAAPLFMVQAEEVPGESISGEKVSGEEAGALFSSRCSMCHQLPEPGMLKAKQWQLILVTMQQRMQQANVPPLQVQEREMILEYLTARARQ